MDLLLERTFSTDVSPAGCFVNLPTMSQTIIVALRFIHLFYMDMNCVHLHSTHTISLFYIFKIPPLSISSMSALPRALRGEWVPALLGMAEFVRSLTAQLRSPVFKRCLHAGSFIKFLQMTMLGPISCI